jgi:hypothetical protein
MSKPDPLIGKKLGQYEEVQETEADKELIQYVLSHCDQWRTHRDSNYLQLWKEYERMFRGIWAEEDKMRDSERSRLVTPAMQQAIESKQAEISEAVFGRGDFFDITDDLNDKNPQDIELVRRQMHEDFKRSKIKKAIDDVILLAEIYGTGIGEIIVKEEKVLAPATQPIPGSMVAAIGVKESKQFMVGLNPINPRNFLIDPNAETIDDSLGVAIEEYMSYYTIVQGIANKIYRKVNITPDYRSTNLEPVQEGSPSRADKLQVLRWYGLVPKSMLEGLEKTESKVFEIFPEDSAADDYSDMVEAVVVIGDGQYLLKAEESPYMMSDRPVIAYQADSMPGRFWGRGTAEKGYNMQKALDAQMRSHLDSLALTTAPMMAMDATRLPRGAKYEVRPGKNFLVNGNPAEIMMPFKFGLTDSGNMQTAQTFQQMLLQATGTLDSSMMPQQVSAGEASGAGLSMALSGLMKKNKRALINFQEDFLIPFITRAAWRFMQFDPERYPVQDFKFMPLSTMGMIAREYEQQQMIGLMQTLGPQSPITPVLLQGIIQSSSLGNRDEIVATLQKMAQPDPKQAAIQEANMTVEIEGKHALVEKTKADAAKSMAEAQKTMIEAQLAPKEVEAKVVNAVSQNLPSNDDQAQKEFDRRVKIAELMLKEADLKNNTKIVELQMSQKRGKIKNTEDAFVNNLTEKLSNNG